jgi:hypothetical protein
MKIRRRYLWVCLFAVIVVQCGFSQSGPILKIGLVADPQYADKDPIGQRHYRESLWKLEEAIDTFNFYGVDFVQNLGDIIDAYRASYDSILPIYKKLNPHIENHHLLGNHDFSIESSQLKYLLGLLSMPHNYYSYSKEGWRFIVLDATDISFYSNPLHKRDSIEIMRYFQTAQGKPNHHDWNGAIGDKQLSWLKQELIGAEQNDQKVILFSHLPLRPRENAHNLWNDELILEMIEDKSCVVAFINGHNHGGNYKYHSGIHYITIHGMVDTGISSYAILEIFEKSMQLKGFGHQKTIQLISD